jgi:hypothetical protein
MNNLTARGRLCVGLTITNVLLALILAYFKSPVSFVIFLSAFISWLGIFHPLSRKPHGN